MTYDKNAVKVNISGGEFTAACDTSVVFNNPDSNDKGDAITLTVTPDEGYQLKTLTYKNSDDESVNPVTITDTSFEMPAYNVTVTAEFELATYNITVGTLSNGSVTPSNTAANMGEEITLTVTPATGYELATLTVTGPDNSPTDIKEAKKFTMPAGDVTINASFTETITPEITKYTVTVSASTNGSVTADLTSAAAGVAIKLTITPDSGYELETLTVTDADNADVTVTGAGNTRTFTMPAKNVTVTATFKSTTVTPDPVDLTLTADPATLTGGGKVTLTASEEVTSVTCEGVEVTGEGTTWTATLPNETKDYTFTATTADGETAEVTVTVTKKSTSTGSTGSTSTTTTTEKNDDGSTTTTKTNKVTGTITETTTYPDGSKTTVETNKDGSSETTTKLADGTTANVTVDTDGSTEAKVTVSEKAVTAAEGEAVKLPIPPVEEDSEVTVNLPKAAKVEVPVDNATAGTVAVIVNADGTEEIIKTSVATEGGVVMTLDGSATVKIVDNSKNFTDTGNHWAEDDIAFAASHEIFSGTGANTFSPNTAMTRGMIAVVLHNFENNPEAVFDGSFDDVSSDDWYSDGVQWAAAKGIVSGYDNGAFGAEDDITREQLVTILYRYAKASGMAADEQGALDGFSDGGDVSDYAAEAMRWAVGSGLIRGNEMGQLNAKTSATRAEVAAVMARFCVNLNK